MKNLKSWISDKMSEEVTTMQQVWAKTQISVHLRNAIKKAMKGDGSHARYKTLKSFYEYAIEECIATELNINRYGDD